MKKILYDHKIFEIQKLGGVSRYFCELIKNGETLYDPKISGISFDNEYLKSLPQFNKEFLVRTNFKWKKCIVSKLNEIAFSRDISKYYYDIVHLTCSDMYYAVNINKPVVITIHDMILEKFLRYFYNSADAIRYKRVQMGNAAKIIAVSQQTKNDILNIYPEINESKISVVYHGCPFTASENILEKKNYVLYVGSRYKYKNFELFANAVSSILTKYDLDLICVSHPFNDAENRMFEELKIKNRVKNVLVSDEELKKLYEEAICFVFPSLYEGFGIPILEAFALNCPCLLSNASCFPEVAQDAAEYFDPYSLDDMRNAIDKVVSSPTLRSEMIIKGRAVLKNYSWKRCAEKHAKVYNEL